ncbi:AN1-type zinc finger protein 3 isoform X3 [Coregonus clupeaformis]|uniref:AN1-type zinc finger protein 3 isoform X3 n=1 Tax=Coregonus clupeaformis TaxID=59861 RepID=UPI001BE0423C|nr:AN1-type zinc finger protein 3 isoform X3 [Coregonus clupeaformis]
MLFFLGRIVCLESLTKLGRNPIPSVTYAYLAIDCRQLWGTQAVNETSRPVYHRAVLVDFGEVSSTVTAHGTLVSTPTKRPCNSASESESDASTEKQARVGEGPGSEELSSSSSSSHSGPKQRSRRRCHQCQNKLELVQQELGSCRCGYVFCMIHRLPEQHDCLFDHLGRGREEAVLKMVKLERKVGRSCQRIGEECS